MAERYSNIDSQEADALMECVLEYFIKRRDVVLKKLDHARSATRQSISDADSLQNHSIQEMEAYDAMWGHIISLFRDAGIAESDLDKIELILTKIPSLIKRYYDLLVEQDKVLQELMREIQSDEYKKAVEIVKDVQSKPDLMSGLDPKEFEPDIDIDTDKARIIKVPDINKRMLH